MESARAAARALLERHLVACCNLLPAMESHYRWEGALTQTNEVVLLGKTTAANAAQAADCLASLHPYSVPAILTLPAGANASFALWVAGEMHSPA